MSLISLGRAGWRLCDGRNCQQCQRATRDDILLAESWIRLLSVHSSSGADLREFHYRLGAGATHSISDSEVLGQITQAIRGGRLYLCRAPVTSSPSASPESEQANEPDQAAADPPGKAPRLTKTWVEFEVLDMEGNPAPDRHYRAMLPDGSIHEGKLDGRGRVRFSNIDPGTCVFSLDELDKEAWEQVG